jgi:hypothetical protein
VDLTVGILGLASLQKDKTVRLGPRTFQVRLSLRAPL